MTHLNGQLLRELETCGHDCSTKVELEVFRRWPLESYEEAQCLANKIFAMAGLKRDDIGFNV